MKEPQPADLAPSSGKMWDSVVTKYELRPDELRILEDACREADLIDDLEKHLRGADRIVKGSMGQQVINPLISELRQHRIAFSSLMSKLKLPDDGAEVAGSQQRDAANARWAKRSS